MSLLRLFTFAILIVSFNASSAAVLSENGPIKTVELNTNNANIRSIDAVYYDGSKFVLSAFVPNDSGFISGVSQLFTIDENDNLNFISQSIVASEITQIAVDESGNYIIIGEFPSNAVPSQADLISNRISSLMKVTPSGQVTTLLSANEIISFEIMAGNEYVVLARTGPNGFPSLYHIDSNSQITTLIKGKTNRDSDVSEISVVDDNNILYTYTQINNPQAKFLNKVRKFTRSNGIWTNELIYQNSDKTLPIGVVGSNNLNFLLRSKVSNSRFQHLIEQIQADGSLSTVFAAKKGRFFDGSNESLDSFFVDSSNSIYVTKNKLVLSNGFETTSSQIFKLDPVTLSVQPVIQTDNLRTEDFFDSESNNFAFVVDSKDPDTLVLFKQVASTQISSLASLGNLKVIVLNPIRVNN